MRVKGGVWRSQQQQSHDTTWITTSDTTWITTSDTTWITINTTSTNSTTTNDDADSVNTRNDTTTGT